MFVIFTIQVEQAQSGCKSILSSLHGYKKSLGGLLMSVDDSAHLNAVNVLYSDHHDWLVRWLRSRLGCAHNAADLAQDTFTRLLASRNATIVCEPRAYLTTIAKGLMVNWYRRQVLERAWLDALAHMPEAEAPAPEQHLIILET